MPSLSLDAKENISRIITEFIKYTSTVTTVGYGDIVPIGNIGRIVAIFTFFLALQRYQYSCLSVPTLSTDKGMVEQKKKREK
jgi:hypothetical protein